jgi:hypothetical protein
MQIMLGAFDRAQRDCVDDEPGFGAGADSEKSRDLAHANS